MAHQSLPSSGFGQQVCSPTVVHGDNTVLHVLWVLVLTAKEYIQLGLLPLHAI